MLGFVVLSCRATKAPTAQVVLAPAHVDEPGWHAARVQPMTEQVGHQDRALPARPAQEEQLRTVMYEKLITPGVAVPASWRRKTRAMKAASTIACKT